MQCKLREFYTQFNQMKSRTIKKTISTFFENLLEVMVENVSRSYTAIEKKAETDANVM